MTGCHDATDPAVDSGVIAKRGAAPHSGIRIKRAPSREPVRLPVLLGSLRLVAKTRGVELPDPDEFVELMARVRKKRS